MIRDLSSNVSNLCDVIDTRQVLDRLEELSEQYANDEGEITDTLTWIPDDREEWSDLNRLIEEVRNDSHESVENGVTLIRETYFTDYIKDFYADGGGRELHEFDEKTHGYKRIPWDELMSRAPFNCIDWEGVAEEEKEGYSEFDYDGTTYYYL